MDRRRNIPSLDGFRALSILLVILSHLSTSGSFPKTINRIVGGMVDSRIGVEIFFIISGFLITHLLLKEKIRRGTLDLKAFYTRRVLRTFPAFYTYLLVLTILNFLGLVQIPWRTLSGAAVHIINLGFSGNHWLVSHAWSLSVEEQFYLIYPACILFITLRSMKWIWFVSLCVASLVRTIYHNHPEGSFYILPGFFMHTDFLLSGCLVGFLYTYHFEQTKTFFNRLPQYLIYGCIALIWILFRIEYNPACEPVSVPLARMLINVGLTVVIFYFVFAENTLVFRVLNSKAMIFVGSISYSLYIWQQFFIRSEKYWYTELPVNVVLIFGFATLSYYFIELPFLKIKDRYSKVGDEKEIRINDGVV